MLITEGLELAVGPGVKDPILDTSPGTMSGLLGLVPVRLNLVDKAVAGRSSLILSLLALRLQVGAEISRVPVAVGSNDMIVPIFLDQ